VILLLVIILINRLGLSGQSSQ